MKHGVRSALALVAAVCPVVAASQPVRPPPPGPHPTVLTSLGINDTASAVARQAPVLTLTHVVAGARPHQYRISARADMANALWMPYETPLQLQGWQSLVDRTAARCDGRRAGKRLQLFLQVRTEMGGSVRIVSGQRVIVPQQVESNIVSDAICVVDSP